MSPAQPSPAEPASTAALAAALLRAAQEGPPLASCVVIHADEAAPVTAGSKMLVRPSGERLGRLAASERGRALEDAVTALALAEIPRHTVATFAFAPDGTPLPSRRAVAAAPSVVEVLVEVVEPSPVLLVVGGGHVGRAIAEMGAFLGMSVAVLDDREEYANQERFPFADRVICGDFEPELDRFPVTSNTYVVLVSRGHKVDELSLRRVVGRGAAYVGMIGSKRRTRTVLEHLQGEGVPAEALAQVFTPIGLDIGAETPEEIALAILSEMVLVRRGGGGRPLSEHGQAVAQGEGRPVSSRRRALPPDAAGLRAPDTLS